MTGASRLRFAIKYVLAGLLAFAGSAVLLRLRTANPLLSHVVAALLVVPARRWSSWQRRSSSKRVGPHEVSDVVLDRYPRCRIDSAD
jgi:hypothetical protein